MAGHFITIEMTRVMRFINNSNFSHVAKGKLIVCLV